MKTLPPAAQRALSSRESKALRARAHALNPVVMIAEDGLSPGVLAEIERNLKSHELIKIRVFGADRADREALLTRICADTGAQPVQHIGKILVVYRKKPAKPVEARPAGKRRQPSGSVKPFSRNSRRPASTTAGSYKQPRPRSISSRAGTRPRAGR